jgi:4'-phosphopantetheinyl transferase EntD
MAVEPSAVFSSILPAGVVAMELRGPADPATLHPAERASLQHAVDERLGEFAGGRLCARRAMVLLGIEELPILRGASREPLWPEPVVGSITHTDGWCAAAVARRSHLRALGIDTEIAGAVGANLVSTICTAEEVDWLKTAADDIRPAALSFIFGAKEAFYKCQFPITRLHLDFRDVRIDTGPFSRSPGRFEVRPAREVGLPEDLLRKMTGRYCLHQQFVSAALALAP